jgi:SnoaL-like domain
MERTSTSLEVSADLIADFEREWIDAWNAHDIDRILSHYRDDVRFVSPFAARAGAPHGELRGRPALRDYFDRALASYPALHFQPIAALAGVRSIALHYHSVEDRQAIEVMELEARGQVRRVAVHYTAPAAPSPAGSVASTHATDKS